MISRLIRSTIRLSGRRSYYLPKLDLDEVLEYKRNRKGPPLSETERIYQEDKKANNEDLKRGSTNKQYIKIMDDWKNNLIKKQKKAERKNERLKNLEPVQHQDSKLVSHKFGFLLYCDIYFF